LLRLSLMPIFARLWVLAGAVFAVHGIWRALKTGRVRAKFITSYREEQPFQFYSTVASFGAIATFLFLLAIIPS
jgi:hypothetical protein